MVSEPVFLESAGDALEAYDRLEGLKKKVEAGGLSAQKYGRYRDAVGERLTRLKAIDLKSLENSISRTDEEIRRLQDRKSAGKISGEPYYSENRRLKQLKDELEGVRSRVELSNVGEYVTFLRERVAEYERTGKRKTPDSYAYIMRGIGLAEIDEIPLWSVLAPLLVAYVALVVGLASGSLLGLLVALAALIPVAILLAAYMAGLHAASKLLDIENRSLRKAAVSTSAAFLWGFSTLILSSFAIGPFKLYYLAVPVIYILHVGMIYRVPNYVAFLLVLLGAVPPLLVGGLFYFVIRSLLVGLSVAARNPMDSGLFG